MVSDLKKRQQNRKLLSQLKEYAIEFLIEQINHEAQPKNRVNKADADVSLNNANNSTQVSCSQVNMHTVEKKKYKLKWIVWWQRSKLEY